MRVTLRGKSGVDVVSQDLAGLPAYPDIITFDNQFFILKRVMPDKQSAYYYEANKYDITSQEEGA